MRKAQRERLADMVEDLRERKQAAKDAAESVHEMEAQIMEVLAEHGQDSFETKDANGKRLRATVVQGERSILDEQRFKKKVGAQMWNKVTTRVVDKRKLKAFIASNEIKANVVAECSETYANKPYVKVS